MTLVQRELPEALMLPAEAVVRGKREQLLDRMEELARWRITAEGEVAAMHPRISKWNLPKEDRSNYILRYRTLARNITRAERVSTTLNAELTRRM